MLFYECLRKLFHLPAYMDYILLFLKSLSQFGFIKPPKNLNSHAYLFSYLAQFFTLLSLSS